MSDTPIQTAPAWQAEGAARYRAGDLAGAIDALSQAARLAPAEPAYLLNLAELARMAGRRDVARTHLDRAAALTGTDVEALDLLSAAWADLGDVERALDAALNALASGGGMTSRRLFAEAVKAAAPRPAARDLLAQALREGWVRTEGLGVAALRLLRAAWPNTPEAMLGDALLAASLTSMVICDVALEQRLIAVRRQILLQGAPPRILPLAARLATQCHLNEYAWALDDAEQAAVDALAARFPALTPVEVATLASYQSLDGLPNAQDQLDADWPDAIKDLLQEQVAAPIAERAIGAGLPALTAIRQGVSAQVREFYEANPYPRWRRSPLTAPAPLAAILRNVLPGVRQDPPPAASPDVLIAGCGTGQHAIQAARYQNARILAVDLSRASLGHAARKAKEAGLGDIAFAQADLLELGGAGRTFDVIECSGVLHHLADPTEGARVLAGVLRPGGYIKLGLYSALGRQPLQAAKDLARGYPPTADGIRALRSAIMAAPADHPVRAALQLNDFYATSPCRDLLKHVQERQLTIGDIKTMLADCGLRFLGFSGPPGVLAAYRARFPGADAADLDTWALFEAERPQTFIGMYQLWAQKPA